MKNHSEHTLVFGLTADPIHKGHEQVILNSFVYAQQHQLNIEQCLLVPTYQPNLIANKQQPQTAFRHRFNMCELVAEQIRAEYNFPVYITDLEQQLYKMTGVKSYSYDTLKATIADNKLFVLSADHFSGRWPKFRKWHKWQQLVKENGLLIHQRPGHGINASFIEQLRAINPEVYVVTGLPSIEVSSTHIRNQFKHSKNIGNKLISESIINYVLSNNLY